MIKIGNVEIHNNIVLSPMAGISDSPYRQLTREMGSGFSYTEFVSTDGISHHSKKSIDLFRFQEMERPISFQVFGNNLEIITKACRIIEDLGPDIIDLNMGCSVAKVSHRGSGAGLLLKPAYVGKIIESMVRTVKIPITAKIRIGWDHDNLNYREIVHVLQEAGIQAISVHGRTKKMGYTGLSDWNIIAEIKSFAKVPIFGNGDITTYAQARERIKTSGVDGVLVGRAAIGNPWIFAGIDKSTLSFYEVRSMIFKHLGLMTEFYGEQMGLVLFRKHVAKYLKNYFGVSELRHKLVTTPSLEDFIGYLNTFNPNHFEMETGDTEVLQCDTFTTI